MTIEIFPHSLTVEGTKFRRDQLFSQSLPPYTSGNFLVGIRKAFYGVTINLGHLENKDMLKTEFPDFWLMCLSTAVFVLLSQSRTESCMTVFDAVRWAFASIKHIQRLSGFSTHNW